MVVLGQEEEGERLAFDVSGGLERVLVQRDLVWPVGEVVEEEGKHGVGQPRRDNPRPQDRPSMAVQGQRQGRAIQHNQGDADFALAGLDRFLDDRGAHHPIAPFLGHPAKGEQVPRPLSAPEVGVVVWVVGVLVVRQMKPSKGGKRRKKRDATHPPHEFVEPEVGFGYGAVHRVVLGGEGDVRQHRVAQTCHPQRQDVLCSQAAHGDPKAERRGGQQHGGPSKVRRPQRVPARRSGCNAVTRHGREVGFVGAIPRPCRGSRLGFVL